ncbi:hypothetical protein RND81_02G171000 [Saponaria officinalis]|uniref:Tf2-1-like SH3-like domain-containing protein n=1 Tax=Saponaria officinalis TaxID=3572 RepID=A0AAW1MXT4_SAPOF
MKMLQFQLQKAQNWMKQQADRNRSEREFNIGDWVYLKLQSYRQMSIQHRGNEKLSQKYYGPFQIIDKIGRVSYKLHFPSYSQIHPVFHVSQLKKCYDSSLCAGVLPALFHDSSTPKVPEAIIERQLVKRGRVAATKILVKWLGLPIEDATWMFYNDFIAQFPNSNL